MRYGNSVKTFFTICSVNCELEGDGAVPSVYDRLIKRGCPSQQPHACYKDFASYFLYT